jgi:hypothetical protein
VQFEVDWPDGTLRIAAGGVDSVQALHLALELIGAQLYASDHPGGLMWLEPRKGYGFPVTRGIQDMLIGDDRTL